MQRGHYTLKRLVINSLMIALYLVLAMFLAIPLGGLKITIEGLPVIIVAVLFGPADAAVVGFVAEFINQMLTYGFTPTTLLWIAPAVIRGLVVGLCLLPLKKSGGLLAQKIRPAHLAIFYAVNMLSAVAVSLANTFTLYVDSKMYGYYTYAYVFGALITRIVLGLLTTAGMATVTLPIVAALRRAGLIQRKDAP